MERKTFTIKDEAGNDVEAVRIALYCFVDEATRELWGQVAADRDQGIAAFLNDAIREGVKGYIEAFNADPEGVATRAAERAATRKTPAVGANGQKLSPEEKQANRLTKAKADATEKLAAAHAKAEQMKAAAAQRLADLEAGILPTPKPRVKKDKVEAPIGDQPVEA